MVRTRAAGARLLEIPLREYAYDLDAIARCDDALSGSVMELTALDFLVFGLPPGSPSLGEMLQQGKSNIQAPWLGLAGFFTVAVMMSLLIFIGEAARDAFDPRKTFQ